VEFQLAPASGAYSGEAEFSAVLTSGDTALGGQQLSFSLGGQQRWAVTDGDGKATVVFPLHGTPGDYTVSATFAGSAGYQRSSASSTFTILKQETLLTFLQDPGVAQYSDDAFMMAELTDADGSALGEMTVLFLISGEGQTYAVPATTDLLGRATASRVLLPVGEYSIIAHFGEAVEVNGEWVDLTDPNYGGASASGTLEVLPEEATVTCTGDTTVPQGSTELLLEAVVTQADDGAPGDISLATVQYEIYDLSGIWVMEYGSAPVHSNGTSEITATGLEPGVYLVRPSVTGNHFTSNPSVPMGDLNVDPALFQVNNETTASAVWSDLENLSVFKAIWDWGDGTTCDTSLDVACVLTEPGEGTPGTVTGDHTYTGPGVYTVRLTLLDGEGHTAEAIYEFVVVYSLDGGEGFVTGGGWIWSEPGWCQLDDLCAAAAGKASFGFVSRYKKGADAPTGTTEFSFSAGGLNFHSDSYEWLVVNQAGTNAQFKGAGTINGGLDINGNPYKFMIWAQDEDPDGDAFRVKIWYELDDGDEEYVVYDNGFDQLIDGGSIVIHQGE
jgi:hypothetical protein